MRHDASRDHARTAPRNATSGISLCEGQGWGIFRFEVCDTLACATGDESDYTTMSQCAPGGQQPDGDDCPDKILLPDDPDGDLGDIPVPGACCLPGTGASAVEAACLEDCLWAACRLAVDTLEQAAASTGNANAKDDLEYWAMQLGTQPGLEACVSRAMDGMPVNLGDGVGSKQTLGDLIDGSIQVFCDITGTTAPPEPIGSCQAV